MTPQEFHDAMIALDEKYAGDKETLHARADDLLCKVLTELGYEKGLLVYETMDKWYA